MISIRQEQADALSRHQVTRFEVWMLDHVKTFWPERFAKDGESAMRELVRDGVRRAQARGFSSERDVCKYIDLMIAYGSDFHELPWAKDVLESREPRDPAVRIDSLCQVALNEMPAREQNDR